MRVGLVNFLLYCNLDFTVGQSSPTLVQLFRGKCGQLWECLSRGESVKRSKNIVMGSVGMLQDRCGNGLKIRVSLVRFLVPAPTI